MKLNSVNKTLLTLLVIASASLGGRTFAQQKWAGMQFQGQDFLNKMVVAVTKYVGECPGSKFDQVAKYTFRSHVEPAPGLEVLIENISPGARTDKKKPYTVRRYDTAQGAEFAEVKIHDHGKHGKKHLTVLPGKNTFEWKIFEGDFDKKSRTVTGLVDSGKFYIEMENDVRTVQRDIEYSITNYCKQYHPRKPTLTDGPMKIPTPSAKDTIATRRSRATVTAAKLSPTTARKTKPATPGPTPWSTSLTS